jgi:hypothetical protein
MLIFFPFPKHLIKQVLAKKVLTKSLKEEFSEQAFMEENWKSCIDKAFGTEKLFKKVLIFTPHLLF